jgi:hypothetical protein
MTMGWIYGFTKMIVRPPKKVGNYSGSSCSRSAFFYTSLYGVFSMNRAQHNFVFNKLKPI